MWKRLRGKLAFICSFSILLMAVAFSIEPVGRCFNQMPGIVLVSVATPLFIWFIILPLWQLMRMQTAMPDLESIETCEGSLLVQYARYMARSADPKLAREIKAALKMGRSVKPHISEFIRKRDCQINEIIGRHAVLVAGSTAISANGFLDSLAIIGFNFRMVKDIAVTCGGRPGALQLIRIYVNVLVTSLMAYSFEELLESSGIVQSLAKPLENIPFVGGTIGAITQGVSNGLLTLRIGYITRSLILTPNLSKKEIRYDAFKQAIKTVPDVIGLMKKDILNRIKPPSI